MIINWCHTMTLPTYSSRMEMLWKILEKLALNKEVYQKKLGNLVGCSYRTAMRQLQLLNKLGLIRLARTEESSKRGKDCNIWEITFDGLLQVLQHKEELIDQIAQVHSNKWLVFHEWEAFSKDPEVKDVVVLGISVFVGQKPTIFRSRVDLKEISEMSKILTQEHKGIFDQIEKLEKTEATLKALRLDLIFTHKAWPPWLDPPYETNHILVRLWKICWHNKKIRKFMEQQFELEKLKHQYLLKFEEFFNLLD